MSGAKEFESRPADSWYPLSSVALLCSVLREIKSVPNMGCMKLANGYTGMSSPSLPREGGLLECVYLTLVYLDGRRMLPNILETNSNDVEEETGDFSWFNQHLLTMSASSDRHCSH